jgi:hypothetical protein
MKRKFRSRSLLKKNIKFIDIVKEDTQENENENKNFSLNENIISEKYEIKTNSDCNSIINFYKNKNNNNNNINFNIEENKNN